MAKAMHQDDAVDGGRALSSRSAGGGSMSGRGSFSSADQQRTSFDSTCSGSSTFSTRCESMAQRRREFPSELDFRIQASKEHWSELSTVEAVVQQHKKQPPLGVVIARAFLGRKVVAEEEDAQLPQSPQEVFERLKQEQHSFFQDFADLELGGKIAEGGQAEIYEARCSMRSCDGSFSPTPCVVKVMKEGFSLQSLQAQWSPKLRRRLSQGRGCGETQLIMADASVHGTGTSSIIGGTLLKNGRFAFVLEKYCCDLRGLIDLKMQELGNQGPPFEERVAVRIMGQIARGMYTLHKSNILHRDLKASNVLVVRYASGRYVEYPDCFVADFECSVGVVGTGFWRAPEILRALQNRTSPTDACSQRADVYSFGMACYEVLTGLVPFEGQPMANYDLVLRGHRPHLPEYVDPAVRSLLGRCWDADPSKRPSFERILKVLAGLLERDPSGDLPFYGWRASHTWYLDRSEPAPPDSSPPDHL